MNNITKEQIIDIINNCKWNEEVHGVRICTGMCAPCVRTIERGECDTIMKLFHGEDDK